MTALHFYRMERKDAPDGFPGDVYAPAQWRSGRWWYMVSVAPLEVGEQIASTWQEFFDALPRGARDRVFLVDCRRDVDAGGQTITVNTRIPAVDLRPTDRIRVKGKPERVASSALKPDESHLRYLPPMRFAGHPPNAPVG